MCSKNPGTFMSLIDLLTHETPKFSNDLKNVSRHCGGQYNIKIQHFDHFLGGGRVGGGSSSSLLCQVGLMLMVVDHS